ncbi:GNAT family N-acetyltransferase [Salinispira pacifica]|uniref:GNAT family acetyltransferase n=1 Tax=Salinispira pacifica TaxID=1307761 RepID=V5WID0_9SPIO|nr:GNAT family N-acetyltransferase [Salinispira pacifica]AHC14926.1 GNAT family acetyltransferase [Salinispira pacifica]
MESDLYLETDRLIIRNHRLDDWEDLYEYLSIPEIYRFEPGKPLTREEAKIINRQRCESDVFLVVELKQKQKMIGHLYTARLKPDVFMTWELGYIFHPLYQNRGYCSEAAAAYCRYAFTTLRAHKVTAFCNPLNAPSWKVLENIGMEREGHIRQKAFFRTDERGNPIWHDAYAYGILNPLHV